jgi:hypothetical protein
VVVFLTPWSRSNKSWPSEARESRELAPHFSMLCGSRGKKQLGWITIKKKTKLYFDHFLEKVIELRKYFSLLQPTLRTATRCIKIAIVEKKKKGEPFYLFCGWGGHPSTWPPVTVTI